MAFFNEDLSIYPALIDYQKEINNVRELKIGYELSLTKKEFYGKIYEIYKEYGIKEKFRIDDFYRYSSTIGSSEIENLFVNLFDSKFLDEKIPKNKTNNPIFLRNLREYLKTNNIEYHIAHKNYNFAYVDTEDYFITNGEKFIYFRIYYPY